VDIVELLVAEIPPPLDDEALIYLIDVDELLPVWDPTAEEDLDIADSDRPQASISPP